MTSEGRPVGPPVRSEAEHFIRCPICGEMIDMRDLAQVMEHLHGQEIEEEPTVQ